MIHIKKHIIPFIYTIVIILIGSLISSGLYYFNITNDKLNVIFIYVTSILGILVGSIINAKESENKGIISGLIFFLISFIIMLILSLLIFKTNLSIKQIIYYIILLIFSIFGGIIGKNMDEKATTN